VIITLNEERNIGRCIESLQPVADEIVVVDSFSTDRTRAICKHYNVCYYEHTFCGYAAQKNYANSRASHDHILSLDADEALSETLKDSILAVKKHWRHDHYAFNRLTSFCGRWIRHGGWYPDRKIRLFDRRKARWAGLVHEKIIADQPASTGFLRGDLLHYSYYSVSQYLQKTELYSGLQAGELYEKGARPTLYHFYVKPAYRFFSAFILKKGFLDGYTGFCLAALSRDRLLLKFLKLKLLREEDSISTLLKKKKGTIPICLSNTDSVIKKPAQAAAMASKR
jgi:glycosyltransferase involved in cell wall biosynthesis